MLGIPALSLRDMCQEAIAENRALPALRAGQLFSCSPVEHPVDHAQEEVVWPRTEPRQWSTVVVAPPGCCMAVS